MDHVRIVVSDGNRIVGEIKFDKLFGVLYGGLDGRICGIFNLVGGSRGEIANRAN